VFGIPSDAAAALLPDIEEAAEEAYHPHRKRQQIYLIKTLLKRLPIRSTGSPPTFSNISRKARSTG
jgi:hypothetical protein